MKNAISNIWLLGIIIVFILIFAAYITITINYTQSFKYKNEVLNIIEKHHGMTNSAGTRDSNGCNVSGTSDCTVNVGALQTITLYLRGNSYTAMGNCPDDGNKWYGVNELTWESGTAGANVEVANKTSKYYYCFTKFKTGKISRYSSVYYKVRLFYKFEFPVLSEFFAIKVEGITDEIYNPANDGYDSNSIEYYKQNN